MRPKPKHALPPPWYRRRLLWAGVALVLLVGALVLRAGRAGDDDPFVEPAFDATSTTTPTTISTTTTTVATTTTTTIAPQCIAVSNPSLLFTIAATEAAAVATASADGWFVAKANGATWYTTADPTRDAAGELVPMNDQARADSSSRRDVPPGDTLYNGHVNDEVEADAARECALGPAA